MRVSFRRRRHCGVGRPKRQIAARGKCLDQHIAVQIAVATFAGRFRAEQAGMAGRAMNPPSIWRRLPFRAKRIRRAQAHILQGLGDIPAHDARVAK